MFAKNLSCPSCQRSKGKENETNWKRHLEACSRKKRRFESTTSVAKFFKVTKPNAETNQVSESESPGNENRNHTESPAAEPASTSTSIENPRRSDEFTGDENGVNRSKKTSQEKSSSFTIIGGDKPSARLREEETNNLSSLGDGNDECIGGGDSHPVENFEDEAALDDPNVGGGSLCCDEDMNSDIGRQFSFESGGGGDNLEGDSIVISNDPATFKKKASNLSSNEIGMYLKLGPAQPKQVDLPRYGFPKNSQGRSFDDSFYFKTIPGGEKVKRDWMSYSKSEDKLYCIHCMLYGNRNRMKNLAWVENGFNAWHRKSASILLHETSDFHVEATIKTKMKESSIAVIPMFEENFKRKKFEIREILKHIVDVTVFLAQRCLAFRGHRESKTEKLRGNFKDLVALLAKYSPLLATYVQSVETSQKKKNNLCSWLSQNKMIECVAAYIRDIILCELRQARFFSVSMDTTFDQSRKEQLSVVLRYVNELGEIQERLIALKSTANTTGEKIFDMFCEIMRSANLEWEIYLVGQSYDGGANMRQTYKGVQNRVLQKAPSALFVWCAVHRLHLIVVDFVSHCSDANDLFGSLETLFSFISSSKIRVKIYADHQASLYPNQRDERLKRVTTTRFTSHSRALKTAVRTFKAVIATLNDIIDGPDRLAVTQARGLRDYFLSRRFLLTALTYEIIFDILDPLNSFLQAKDIDLLGAMESVQSVKQQIAELRQDSKFEHIMDKTEQFVELINQGEEEYEFTELPVRRARRRKLLPGEMAIDEPISDPTEKFKISTFFGGVDVILTQFNERFNSEAVSVCKDMALLTRRRILEVKSGGSSSMPEDAFDAFCKIYPQFLDKDKLTSEYQQFCQTFNDFDANFSLPKKLHPAYLNVSMESSQNDDGENLHSDGDGEPMDSDCESLSSDENCGVNRTNSPCPDTRRRQDDDGTLINTGSLRDVFRLIVSCGLKGVFPALYTAYKIAVTLPVSSATTERSFSKLKIIKNRLRTTMGDSRLEHLMITACENKIEIDYDDVVVRFLKCTPSLQKFV